MTAASSTIKTKKERKPSLLGFTLKKYWTSILLFTIILFFVIPIPVMMWMSDKLVNQNNTIENLQRSLAVNWVDAVRYAIIPIMSILAVVIPCARFSYLKNKVSVDFYHSLPIRREKLFFTQLGVGALALVIPYILNIIFTFLYVAPNNLVTGALIVNILMLTLEMLVYALFFYSLSTLVGMASGLTAVHLVLTVTAIFILPVLQLAYVGFRYIFAENMWTDYYLSESIMSKLSPAIRFLINEIPLNLAESIIMVCISLLMLAIALLLYKHRKSERAGQSVVFVPFGEIVKYIIMLVGTLVGGIFFNSMMGNMFWTIFGMLCGMLLTFMLANTILHKTATAMFRGLKGLAIFGGAAIITLIILTTNAFGVNSSVPTPSATSKVVVSFDSTAQIEFHDRANIEAIHKIYTQSHWGYRGYYTNVYPYEQLELSIAFYNSLGIPTAKQVTISNKSDFIDEFKTILNSSEFREQYYSVAENAVKSKDVGVEFYEESYYINQYGRVWYSKGRNYLNIGFDKTDYIFDYILDYMKACDFDYFQNPTFASIRFYSPASYRYGRFPLYTSMETVMYESEEKGLVQYSYDEAIRRLTKAIDSITVYKESNPIIVYEEDENSYYSEISRAVKESEIQKAVVTDKKQIEQLLRASADIFIQNCKSPFTFVDPQYYASFELSVTNPIADECYDMDEDELQSYLKQKRYGDEIVIYEDSREIGISFIAGKTPEFVAGLFE